MPYSGPITLESGEVLLWWDDASYAAYQAYDPYADYEPTDEERLRFGDKVWLFSPGYCNRDHTYDVSPFDGDPPF